MKTEKNILIAFLLNMSIEELLLFVVESFLSLFTFEKPRPITIVIPIIIAIAMIETDSKSLPFSLVSVVLLFCSVCWIFASAMASCGR